MNTRARRHLLVSFIVAPVLAVLAWFAAGQLAGEKPSAEQAGTSYPLLSDSNCRYLSGNCRLYNEDFELQIHYEKADAGLVVTSARALQGIMISVGAPEDTTVPRAMVALDDSGRNWRLGLQGVPVAGDRIRLAAATGKSLYFGDAATLFVERD